jgi:hypothetical protein
MRRLWRRAIGPFKEFGLVAGALYVLDRLLRTVSPRLGLYVYELMEQPIDGRALLPGGLTKNLEFIEIGPDHPAVASMPARTDIKASRFAQGARCLGAYRKGVLLGYIWWCPRRYEEDEVRCTFQLEPAASSVFDFDLYVLPEHRMGIAFMAIWHGANQLFHSIGVRHSFSRVTVFNLPSRRAHARLGGRRVGRVLFLHLWGIEWMVGTVSPYLGLSWSTARRLVLKLAPAGAP